MKRFWPVAFLLLTGWAMAAPPVGDLDAEQREYEASLEAMPKPATAAELANACRVLRIERARQESLEERGLYLRDGGELRARAHRNIALIEAKMAEIRCP